MMVKSKVIYYFFKSYKPLWPFMKPANIHSPDALLVGFFGYALLIHTYTYDLEKNPIALLFTNIFMSQMLPTRLENMLRLFSQK